MGLSLDGLAAFVAELQGMIKEIDLDRINKMGDLNIRFDKARESYLRVVSSLMVVPIHCMTSPARQASLSRGRFRCDELTRTDGN